MLRFVRKLDGSKGPPSYTDARNKALAEAKCYSETHALSRREALILEYSVHSAVVSGIYDPAWKGETLPIGLAQLAAYRAAQTISGQDPNQRVSFLEEAQWPSEWLHEARLSVVFEPVFEERNDDPKRAIISAPWSLSPRYIAHLVCTDVDQDYRPSGKTEDQLYKIRFLPREEPFLWKGSKITFDESYAAASYSHTYSSHTPVSATGRLAAPTFEFIVQLIKDYQPPVEGSEVVWLTIGFPFQGGAIPRPRPIKPEQRLTDAVRIDHQAGRLWLRLDRVIIDGDCPSGIKTKLIGQWMAVE